MHGVLNLHEELTIEAMGAKGDGVARSKGRAIHIPFTLPGEVIVATVDGERGELNDIVTASAERIAPICALFGTCGGCAMQHWAHEPYAVWKRNLLSHALAQFDLTPDIKPLVDAYGTGRRRVVFHARKIDGRVEAGFMARRTHRLVAVDACPILVPALAGAPDLALRIAQIIDTDKPLDIHLTATKTGIDCDIRGLGVPSDRQRRRLVENIDQLGLARLSVHSALMAMRTEPVIAIGRSLVQVPSGTFLQATAAGEETLTRLAFEMADGAKKIADLFCGVGPFSLKLAEKAGVTAFDSDEPAIAALAAAAARTEGLKPVTAIARDLFRVPLVPHELNMFDTVLLDPPRAGARAQMEQIAKSDVARVISVACDVQSFARDAKILVDAGYVFDHVVPVDQFAFSPHLEMVGLFTKTVATKRKRRLLG